MKAASKQKSTSLLRSNNHPNIPLKTTFLSHFVPSLDAPNSKRECAPKPRHGRHRSKTGLKRQSCMVRARVRRAVPKANPSKNTLHMARSRKSRGEVGRLRVSTKQQTIERCVNENNARRPREIDKRSIYSLSMFNVESQQK